MAEEDLETLKMIKKKLNSSLFISQHQLLLFYLIVVISNNKISILNKKWLTLREISHVFIENKRWLSWISKS